MALIFLGEHLEAERTAQVYKWANGLAYEVHMFVQGSEQKETKTFNTEQQADDFAEDWVLEARKEIKEKKNKKNNTSE